ncbi:hypothetical protein DEU56DRAFT_908357 [Suillus clintonianus]|uniref:uncharacterized protein n=1 Tax=Suillus clintonianus TaxID=1904413 RepID=UPI001B87E3E1|nr:uncharacterized protein DEU56DRAFT_908357 [Suillus clintonianus]KAG2151516.1 hypothetical protein DEU56DRAFT_908357 [Suillus clintonianus]
MPTTQPLLRPTTFSNNIPPTNRIRLVPHLDSRRALRFEPVSCDLRDGDTPLRIGRFTDRSDTNKLAFKSKVVSRTHAEIWSDNGNFYIKDTKSTSGTFLNHLRLSPAGSESKPYHLKDGDIVQLGVDYHGNADDNYQSVKIRIEVGHEWRATASASSDRTITSWESSSGEPVGHPPNYIDTLAKYSDNSFITTPSGDDTVGLWSTKTHHQTGQRTTEVERVAISPHGEVPVSGDHVGKVRLWSIGDRLLEQRKAEGRMRDGEAAQQQPLFTFSDTQLHCHDGQSSHPSETDETLATVWDACIAGDLHTAEELLTQEIDEDGGGNDSYAIRSLVRARNFEWDDALQDAVKSIAVQPSLWGYISKGIALCGNQQLWDAMEAFDLAFIFSEHDSNPISIDLLLLIKAVALFNASCHDEAMRRVHDLIGAYQHSDTFPCSVVNSYLRVQLAMIAFDNEQYSEAADQLTADVTTTTGLFSLKMPLEPRLEIFALLFGWDFDSIQQTIHQRRCEAFLRADRLPEAAESLRYMMSMLGEPKKGSCLEWSTAFKQDCTARCVAKADEAVAADIYEMAFDLYSAAIELDSSSHFLFAHRGKAKLGRKLYAEALHDAEKVIELKPSSSLGYELKYAALQGAQRYDEAIEVITAMLSKLDDPPDAHIQKLRQQYLRSEAVDAIGRAIHAHLENAPLRLLNTSTGRLCDRETQINAFMEGTEYRELLFSWMTDARLQTEPIQDAVAKYFSWAMLSHRWESKELLLHEIKDKVVYDLDPVGTTVKLQMFCKIAHDAGYRWAWSDTCCIDQNNNVEVQRSVNSMFVWYRQSALTIVYLLDVPPWAKSGALASSVWNTRGWTIQEFLAPTVVLFYKADWTPYLNNHSPNHKESITIMQELEDSTGIDAHALVAFRPGMTNAREKLQWASTRVTTLQEDIVYSLFGIFGVHLPVIYGEMKQNALGRLLQEIVARSGDITALDWVGKSSEFNSCLPADISSYEAPPCLLPSLSEDEMQSSISMLRQTVPVESALKLYTFLDNLSAPRFANFRLQLPCIAFPVTEIRRRNGQGQELTCSTYNVKADGLQDLLIDTENRLFQFSRARPTQQTFLLVRPWNRYDLGLPDFADNKTTEAWSSCWSPSWSVPLSTPSSLPDHSQSVSAAEHEPVDSESHSRALRLIMHLGQPFSALLLAQQRGGEYKRIASDRNIIAQIRDMTAVDDMMDVRTLEIL